MFVCRPESDYLLASGGIWVVFMTFIFTGRGEGGGALQGEGKGGHCL